MADFPIDIIHNILSFLPVNPLLRFRSVCMAWKHLIDSPNFIKSHLVNSNSLNQTNLNNHNFLVFTHNSLLHKVSDLDKLSMETTKLASPDHQRFNKIIGSWNGLICLEHENHSLSICNPSTHAFKNVPSPSKSYIKSGKSYCLGFGYDSYSDDFKIIGLSREDDAILVYSLRIDSWRKLVDDDEDKSWTTLISNSNITSNKSLLVNEGVVAYNNFLHWIVLNEVIVSFDLRSEIWRQVPLPSDHHNKEKKCLGVFEGCLCLQMMGNDEAQRGRVRSDIWVMKEYGVGESWTKLFSFRVSYEGVPTTYCKEGSEVLFVGACKLGKMKTKDSGVEIELEIDFNVRKGGMKLCVQSLVPVMGNGKLVIQEEEINSLPLQKQPLMKRKINYEEVKLVESKRHKALQKPLMKKKISYEELKLIAN